MSDTDQTEDDPTLAFTRALFGRADETEETDEADDDPGKPTGNYVPNEGNVPAAKDNSDEQFIRALFDN